MATTTPTGRFHPPAWSAHRNTGTRIQPSTRAHRSSSSPCTAVQQAPANLSRRRLVEGPGGSASAPPSLVRAAEQAVDRSRGVHLAKSTPTTGRRFCTPVMGMHGPPVPEATPSTYAPGVTCRSLAGTATAIASPVAVLDAASGPWRTPLCCGVSCADRRSEREAKGACSSLRLQVGGRDALGPGKLDRCRIGQPCGHEV